MSRPAAALMLAALLAGCVASPRASSEIARKSEPVVFSGLHEAPNVELELQAKNRLSGEWVRFGRARTRAEEPVASPDGTAYYRFSAILTLPQAPVYWSVHDASLRSELQARVVDGSRVLTTFGSDAERCVQRLRASGSSDAELFQGCAAPEPSLLRIFAASCGELGEACCPASLAAASCAAALSCERERCVEPGYPLPWLADHRVDLALPAGYRLRDAWLELDDRAQREDTRRRLLAAYRSEPGVSLSSPHRAVARLGFDVPFFKTGINRYVLRAVAERGAARRALAPLSFQLEYSLPRGFGRSADGSLRLPSKHFPRDARSCGAMSCKDADRDGLNDLWENLAIEQLRPRLRLDRDDALFRHKQDSVRVLSSLSPLRRSGRDYVLLANVVAFSRDYGYYGILDHPGDTEAFGMLYRVEQDGGLRWVSSVARGHGCLTCSPRFHVLRQEFAPDGVPLVYVERDKHGLWQNGSDCRARAAFSCRGDRELRPPASNVGEFSEDGSRGLIDALDGLALGGVFGELAGVFPGDAIWSAQRARIPGRFCGGVAACAPGRSATQPGQILAKLFDQLAMRVE